ncbi:UNVERIFIED_CONTAM: protein SUPPRESSOR OF QUENCHING 1, chloroplastic [Sesamum radiatum]|uniref:Protein SUPPRESSOR OF QUENCHING 1, chloroplastic n=1 Tax=Sesamum radiatum TaxID=300843 RepID=A0AAW2U7T2_SESRA
MCGSHLLSSLIHTTPSVPNLSVQFPFSPFTNGYWNPSKCLSPLPEKKAKLPYILHFFWPSGRIFIADTNNSIIRVLDLNNGEPRLLTLELKGVQPPVPKSKSLRRLRRRSAADTETIVIDGGSSNEGKLCLKISVPEGYHLSKEAQSKFSVEFEPENATSVDPVDGTISTEGSAVIQFKRSSPSSSKSRIYCKVYYCKEDEVCLYQPLMFEVSFQEAVPDAAPAEISLPYVVKPKSPTFNSQSPLPR